MPKVILKRNWFAPDGKFYRFDDGAVEIPQELIGKLPTTAKVVEAKKEKIEEKSERDEMFEEADKLGLKLARNISNDKLKEALEAKRAEIELLGE